MRLVTLRNLRMYQERYASAAAALGQWRGTKAASWTSPIALQRAYGHGARPISNERVIFNVCGNDYRLVAAIRWAAADREGIVFIKFFGTHAEYDRIDALTVDAS